MPRSDVSWWQRTCLRRPGIITISHSWWLNSNSARIWFECSDRWLICCLLTSRDRSSLNIINLVGRFLSGRRGILRRFSPAEVSKSNAVFSTENYSFKNFTMTFLEKFSLVLQTMLSIKNRDSGTKILLQYKHFWQLGYKFRWLRISGIDVGFRILINSFVTI